MDAVSYMDLLPLFSSGLESCENEATPSVSCSLNLPFDNQVLMIVFYQNQHIVLLPVRTSPVCCILLVVSELVDWRERKVQV